MMTCRRDGKFRGSPGFTLLELLVALLLLGLISTLALGGVRLGARTWETVSEKAGDNGRTQMIRAFLRRELAQAAPVFVPDSGGADVLAYDGRRDSLLFVAPLPSHFGLGGFQRLELAIIDDAQDIDAGKQLVLRRRLFHRKDVLDKSEEDDELHVLLEGIDAAEFVYRESGTDGGAWSSDWRGRDSLPAMVKLRVTFKGERRAVWPDLLIAGRITTPAGCLPGETSRACRGR
ncbi:MAG: prepilin-type N-terminal cleavage/methylation domain-containing protein [Alphaproteobacteria bacterium]|nr:prepilin-type N-terminal cleavage/methylation domain-containing protein [Alphaproteobacteria bacterium]